MAEKTRNLEPVMPSVKKAAVKPEPKEEPAAEYRAAGWVNRGAGWVLEED